MTDKIFQYVRPASAADLPAARDDTVDVALLDMNHGTLNVGLDAVVDTVRNAARALEPVLHELGRTIRVVCFDVRLRGLVPEHHPRYALYIGTGGPGHPDPRCNVRDDDASALIVEDGSWELPFFRLLDAIRADRDAAFLGVCQSFGVLCRWAGVADPVLRSREQGASIGLRENVLSDAAMAHPWFSHLSKQLPDGRRFPVLDSRHYDLIPHAGEFEPGVALLGYESLADGSAGPALTMLEVARSEIMAVPRIFGVNFHAEIGDADALQALLSAKVERGEVSRQWYESRAELLPELRADPRREELRLAGVAFCFVMPVYAHLVGRLMRAERPNGPSV